MFAKKKILLICSLTQIFKHLVQNNYFMIFFFLNFCEGLDTFAVHYKIITKLIMTNSYCIRNEFIV